MASKPVQRSLKHLRDNGWIACIVEKYIKHPNMEFGKRIDAFGIGDLLACRAAICEIEKEPCVEGCDKPHSRVVSEPTIALIQCCSTDFAAHKEKILGIPEYAIWKAAGGEIILHGWAKRGPRGKRKTYQLREEFL